MKEIIAGLNKNFENRVRLGIMSALMVNDVLDFNALKELLGVTDGNLASHLKALEKHELILVSKRFIGRKPNTTYEATEYGRLAFKKHLTALEQLLGNT
ncbi:winged helix-turn-helix domain-containing protein [Carboxylicivirga linearis]|uniref:Transcriptional regulator n=1 Tax=Carboxylicivirga linearis TaxID=1628157 RepID=A0ABS5JQ92_9BACT|nr:transcriptional regulator [Carboxylicivirga linearis]MBS2097039.1 transcriptional regulator [Carboxylicivirga linearis]